MEAPGILLHSYLKLMYIYTELSPILKTIVYIDIVCTEYEVTVKGSLVSNMLVPECCWCSTRAVGHQMRRFQRNRITADRQCRWRSRMTYPGSDRHIELTHPGNRVLLAIDTAANKVGSHNLHRQNCIEQAHIQLRWSRQELNFSRPLPSVLGLFSRVYRRPNEHHANCCVAT